MSSFIPKQEKPPAKKRLVVQLREDIADEAKRYAEYLESDLDHVIEQLFLKAFKSDKDFQKSKQSPCGPTAPGPVRTSETKPKSGEKVA